MSQPLLILILSEALAALLIILLVLLGFRWRDKRRRQAELEQLLDDIIGRQALRSDRLALLLGDKYRLDGPAAQALAESLILAEKQFLYSVVEQQMRQAVSGFYENLCGLLDSYLDSMPRFEAKAVETRALEADADTSPPAGKDAENVLPDWGDVFD